VVLTHSNRAITITVNASEEITGKLPRNKIRALRIGISALMLLFISDVSFAGALCDRIMEKRSTVQQNDDTEENTSDDGISLPAGVRVVRDVSYGSDLKQRFDVYIPAEAKGAPIILLVHGGAWALGDKAAQAVVEKKVAHWVPRGFIVISANYRLLPKADPLGQAKDIAQAVAAAQDKAASWGGDRNKFILMGHSAGAHLVSLLAAAPALSSGIIPTPWLGTVSLDSAALDVVKIMEVKHFGFYDRAFGKTPEYWRSASPFHAMTGAGRPILLVCSTKRTDSCSQADQFAAKALSMGTRTSVLKQNLSHADINQKLGESGAYTEAVETFLGSLNESIARMLTKRSNDKHQ